MPVQLVLDDIIFRLQAFGGASEFWTSLTEELATEPDLTIRHVQGSQAHRLLPVKTSRNEVLHSSHFRVPVRRGAPCVTTIHDLNYENGLVRGRTAPLNLYERRRSVRGSSAIVCISDFVKDDFLSFYGADIPTGVSVSTIYHGRTYEQPENRELVGFEQPPGGYALVVGNRRGYKNFEAAIGGLAKSGLLTSGLELWCTGPGCDAEDLAVMSSLGVPESAVRFIGVVSRDDLAALYENAFALLYPSRSEGFGLPPLDAMSLGCPVIGSRASSVQEIVAEGGILLDPDDVDAFGAALASLADPGTRAKLIAAGREQAEKFSWKRAANEYQQLYIAAAP